jgi:hypothetical protein
LTKADKVEARERKRSAMGQIVEDKSKPEVVNEAHKLFLGNIQGHPIWVVNGEMVRDKLDTDFTEGGHGLVYNYIPNNEIWLDDQVQPSERKAILAHELHENIDMNKGLKYDKAHQRASEFEHRIRMKYQGGV